MVLKNGNLITLAIILLERERSLSGKANFCGVPSMRPQKLVNRFFDSGLSALSVAPGAFKLREKYISLKKALEVRKNLHMVSRSKIRPEALVAGPLN